MRCQTSPARPLDRVSVALNTAVFAALVVGAEVLVKESVLAAVLLAAAAIGLAVLGWRARPQAASS